MTKYIITTESGSDLKQDVIDRYDVRIVPMHVTMGDKTYIDGSFPVTKAFDYYKESGQLPKTSGSTPQDNTEVFQQVFADYPDAQIIHIGYSAVTTVSFNAARIASEEFKAGKIHLVDSKNVTLGLASIVEETAEYIEANPTTTPSDIIAFVEDIRERVRFIFLPKTLVYLHAGGRVSNMAFHGANLLNLHPTIKVEDGYLKSDKKYRGSFERCLKKTIDDFFKRYDIDPETIKVGGSPGVSSELKDLAYSLVAEHGATHPGAWFDTGTVISSHGGPEAFGMVGIERP